MLLINAQSHTCVDPINHFSRPWLWPGDEGGTRDEACVTDEAVASGAHQRRARFANMLIQCQGVGRERWGPLLWRVLQKQPSLNKTLYQTTEVGPHVSSAPVIKCRCLSAPGYMGMSPGQAQAVKAGDVRAFSSFTETSSIVMKLKGHGFVQKHSYFILHEHLWARHSTKTFFTLTQPFFIRTPIICYTWDLSVLSVRRAMQFSRRSKKHLINICALRCLVTYWHIHRYRLIWDKCQPVWLIGRVLR